MRHLPHSGIFVVFLAFAFVFFSTGDASAHPGHPHPPEEVDEFEPEAFFSAAAHPFTGVDHLLAMLAAGALAAGGRRGLGIAFASAVGLGFASGMASPPWMLALPLVMAGWFLWKGPPVAKMWVWGAVVMTGFLHGGAHADGMSGIAAGLGLFAGTMAGVCLGGAAAVALKSLPPIAIRVAGASVAVLGVLLTVTRLSL